MKILHILDHSLPLHSGYTFRSQNIFRAQQRQGWAPVILTSSKHEQSWKGKWAPKEEIGGLTYYRTGAISNKLPVIGEIFLMWALYCRILDVAQREKPGLLHAHSPVLNAIPAIRAGRRLGLPVIYEIRAFWEDAAVDHRTYSENSLKYRMVKALETWACKKVDHVTILCKGLKDDLIRRGIPARKITPIFNAVDPDTFNPCAPDAELQKEWGLEGKMVIGFIGSFYRYEGLDLLVEAFALIAEDRPEAMLLLVGGGEMAEELLQAVARHSLSGRVILPGRIPHERISGVYALVDILVYPRYSMRLTELVTPLKPLEAMAMGKVVVASDVGGHKELIRADENGVLFRAESAEMLAKEIDLLIDDKKKMADLRDRAREWIRRHHTWEITTRPYVQIYNRSGEGERLKKKEGNYG